MNSIKTPKRPFFKRKSTWIVLLLLVVVVLPVAFLARGSEPPPCHATGERMKAVVYHEYGLADVLRLEDVEKCAPNDNQVLIRIHAAAANPLDWHYMRGTPYLMRLMGSGVSKPNDPRMGVDMAGVVEAVGKHVTKFKPGDEVFGVAPGAFAEYARAREVRIAVKPASLTFEQAAAVPVAAMTALQGLRDEGKIKAGQKVLINGASGGVGTFAVQIAKAFGAEVTGVCSTRNVELVRSLGADHVIDYKKEDFSQGEERYDLILDNVGTQPLSSFRRVLKPEGTLVMIGGGGPSEGQWVGPMARPLKALVMSPFVSQNMGMLLADVNTKDLGVMAELMEAKKVTPVIDRTYKLSETPEAIRYLEKGHARGKVVITMEPDTKP